MPTGTLPEKGKALFEKIYNDSLSESCDKECAARKAWSGVKAAGWRKGADGEWHKKADISSFSLVVKRASQDPVTGEMRWRADTSDVGDDLAKDNMTLELFSDFVNRIEQKQLAPEMFRSEFWQGGMPYLSISHYDDSGGSSVPGMPTAVYVDGSYLKAKGILYDTPLGKACWKALKSDLTGETDNPVQISIGFIDWEHIHKSDNYRFVRETVDDVCPACLLSIIKGQTPGNRSFVKGQLVHLALTRVPMNQRTSMLADIITTEGDIDDMTTRVEDAESIVGSELAELLEKEAKAVSKSLVVKSEDETPNEVLLALKSLTEELSTLKSEIATLKANGKPKEDEEEKKKKDMPMEDEEDEDMPMHKADLETLKSAFTDALSPMFADLGQRLDIVATALADKSRSDAVPQRRSITGVPAELSPSINPQAPNKLRDLVRRSVGLE